MIVDAHPAAREGLSACLARQTGLEACGEADDIPGALRLIAAAEPDVAVLGLALKGGSGLDLLKRIRDRHPTVRVLVWSLYSESTYAERALRAGASGYIDKEQPTEAVAAAVRHVLAGGVYLSPAMTETLLRQAAGNPREVGTDPVSLLSDRELEVFRLIGMGLDTQQIASRLHLSPKTVETYRGRLKQKLGVDSRTEVIRLAVRWVMEHSDAPPVSGPGPAAAKEGRGAQ